ncbi:hypothetical protein CYMTET_50561, partial [Cymbomonas tetramitiformis]
SELNLSYSKVNDSGVMLLSSNTALTKLNLDSRLITDTGLEWIGSLTGLMHLDLFGAKVSNRGTVYLKNLKALLSLELCGGGITDLTQISNLTGLTSLNLSQNCRLSDTALQNLSPLTGLRSLNLTHTRVTSNGMPHLQSLVALSSLALYGCKVSPIAINKLRLCCTRLQVIGVDEAASRK